MRIIPPGDATLLAALHEGVFEQPLWETFLAELRAQTQATQANLILRPFDGGPPMRLSSGRMLPAPLRDIAQERFGPDPLRYQTLREGRVHALDDLLAPGDAGQRAFHDDVLVPGGMRHRRVVRVAAPGGIHAWLTIIADTPFGGPAASLMSRIAPHLRIALRTFAALEAERTRASIASEAFGRLNFGWVTLTAQCRIVDRTPNMDLLLQRSGLLRRGRYDRLTFTDAQVDRAVGALVRGFAAGAAAGRPKAINLGQDPWTDILVAPVMRAAASAGSAAVAIVYCSGDRWSRQDRCAQLVDMFGLLPSEARLAWGIAQGQSIRAAADTLGLTLETARSYSKRIYAKTGAGGQADLVRIVLSSVLAIV